MKHQTYDWKDKQGRFIFGQSWLPDSEPLAVICHLHGQSDHSSRFAHVAAFFVKNNIAFMTADLIGHGKSAGVRGHVLKFEEYLDTVDLLIDAAEAAYARIPIFIYGHSMGGNIALNYAVQTQRNIRGYIITSPWIRLAFEPPAWKVALGKTVKSIYPALLQPTGLDVNAISRDKEVVAAYSKDPLVHGKISASGFFEILMHGKNILTAASQLKAPILLMHGTGDQLTSYIASRALAEQRKDIITYKEFDGLYHELHNEPEKQLIFDAMLSWIQTQLKY